ncbi:type II toxin-antitoxin system VapC family toxin [Ruania zhangjianzhongii]|uniref:type II toxin-antitoxin system VapC family toxin n=1 Tax=Ruania zhangjianzhongii TaxID=2603206 RepID=UPI0016528B04|nr:type II toxin-antitoxin system VapC family toxin [Ruania zhangjianzhongii]
MSGYLLDTHLLLWAGVGSDRLPRATRTVLEDPAADVRFSVVSLWEIVIKLQLGRADFQIEPEALRAHARLAGLVEVEVSGEHVLAAGRLPAVHQDPFDRLLIAQARQEGLQFLTVDEQVLAYGAGVQRG